MTGQKRLTVSDNKLFFVFLLNYVIYKITHNINEVFLYSENDANLAIPGENLSAKRKHLTRVKFMKVTSCLEIFYEEFKKQYIGRKLNFLYTLLFCFEILLWWGVQQFWGVKRKMVATYQSAAIAVKTKTRLYGQNSFCYLIYSFSLWYFFLDSPPMEF